MVVRIGTSSGDFLPGSGSNDVLLGLQGNDQLLGRAAEGETTSLCLRYIKRLSLRGWLKHQAGGSAY